MVVLLFQQLIDHSLADYNLVVKFDKSAVGVVDQLLGVGSLLLVFLQLQFQLLKFLLVLLYDFLHVVGLVADTHVLFLQLVDSSLVCGQLMGELDHLFGLDGQLLLKFILVTLHSVQLSTYILHNTLRLQQLRGQFFFMNFNLRILIRQVAHLILQCIDSLL